MNIRTILTAAMLLTASTCAFCQTKMIAHRSHGGSMQSFEIDVEDNFGLSPDSRLAWPNFIDSVVSLSDTSAIEMWNDNIDTVYHNQFWNNPDITVDSLRKRFPKINFIGFEKTKKSAGKKQKSKRKASAAYIPMQQDGGRGNGTLLVALFGAIGAPALTYGMWKARKDRSA